VWKVNAGRRSVLASEFLNRNVVAIGWAEAGDYTSARSKDELFSRVKSGYPDWTDRQAEVGVGQIWRFLREVRPGDAVLTYDPATRLYHLGRIDGEPTYRPDDIPSLPVQRAVTWRTSVSRDDLSPRAKGKLGALLTLFVVEGQTAAELEAIASGGRQTPENSQGIERQEEADFDSAADPLDNLQEQAIERIKDRLLALDWDDMQEMVASLLRALGYRTLVSPAGPDRGKDIVASKDGFGFEPPRIVVEVKHRRGAMGAPEIRAFLGGRHAQDKGLYVSTGGFTREAYFEAERASTVTHLMTLDDLARALTDNYERLDERGRALLPLVRVYWPV
jgi:restriction system protein